MTDHERAIRHERNEHLIVADEHGEIVHQGTSGSPYVVRLPLGVGIRDRVVSHNHPRLPGSPLGNPFSVGDVKTAVSHDVKELRVVTAEGLFRLQKKGDRWPTVTDVDGTEFRHALANNRLRRDGTLVSYDYWDGLWRRFARENADTVTYSFEPHADL